MLLQRVSKLFFIIITGLTCCLCIKPFNAFLTSAAADSAAYYVSPSGSDSGPGTESEPWKTIQQAFDEAIPGSTVYIKAGTYNEKVAVNVSGTAGGGYITFQSYGSDKVVLDGTGKSGSNMIYIENKGYIKIVGLEITNNKNVSDGSGIRIEGTGNHIELRSNKIHEMRGKDAMGITVYGTSSEAITDLIIDGNEIYDCDPAESEALTLNGNIDGFEITNNIVHDVNNIGIDMIGGEGTSSDDTKDAARNGICRGNIVYNARSSYGGGYGAGLYVDGGHNITLENNIVYSCDLGIEIGCENRGEATQNITVRSNFIYNNDKRGLSFGGYDYPATGKVKNCSFYNNTCFNNDTLGDGSGELLIEYAENCTVKNNIFYCSSKNRLMTVSDVNDSDAVTLDYNIFYSKDGEGDTTIEWLGDEYDYNDYLSESNQDAHSQFADPLFISALLAAPDLHLAEDSPAIDTGDPGFSPAAGEADIDGQSRISGSRVDIGADEYGQGGAGTTTTTAGPASELPVIDSFQASPSSGYVPLEVSFTCTAHDPDGSIDRFIWDFNGDNQPDLTTDNGSASHTYTRGGTFDATVYVYDNTGDFQESTIPIEVIDNSTDCPSEYLLGKKQAQLDSLRRFRDRVLSATPEGRNLIILYYRHAAEITGLLSARPEIKKKAAALLGEALPMMERRQLLADEKARERILRLIDDISKEGSSSLKKDLAALRDKIRRNQLLND